MSESFGLLKRKSNSIVLGTQQIGSGFAGMGKKRSYERHS